MYFVKQDLGYREVDRLADFAKKVSEKGLPYGEVAELLMYNFRDDCGECISDQGNRYQVNDEGSVVLI